MDKCEVALPVKGYPCSFYWAFETSWKCVIQPTWLSGRPSLSVVLETAAHSASLYQLLCFS